MRMSVNCITEIRRRQGPGVCNDILTLIFSKVKHFKIKEIKEIIIFEMFLKFQLFCLSLLAVTGNKLEIEESTVFIYFNAIGQFDLPDCLGTLITAKYALTGASCFIDNVKNVASLHNFNVKNSVVVRVSTLEFRIDDGSE